MKDVTVNDVIKIWETRFIEIAVLNGSFEQKQLQIKSVVDEISNNFEEVVSSDSVSKNDKWLLFTNAYLYANNYNVDVRDLESKIVAKGLEYLLK